MRALGCSLLTLALATALSCEEETAVDPFVGCPNEIPASGAPCARAGQVCRYFTGCGEYYPATCQHDLSWRMEDGCVPSEGGTPNGSAGPTGAPSSSAASTGGSSSGGQGGGGFGGAIVVGGAAGAAGF
jgi:hypothetical protein